MDLERKVKIIGEVFREKELYSLTYKAAALEILNRFEAELEQLALTGVVQPEAEKVCELVREEFDGWIFGIETQAGEKLKVVDSSDFSEIITELESKLSKL